MEDRPDYAITTDPARLPAQRRTAGVGAVSTWEAVKDAAPEIAGLMGLLGEDAVMARRSRQETFAEHHGFKEWLLANFALNTPSSVIRSDLAAIAADQEADGILATWPTMTKRQIDTARYDLRALWAPIEQRLTANIENVGVLAKNRRLMALANLAERVAEMAFTERNDKTGQFYLVPEFRAILHQIAEEKGELGEQGESTTDMLGQIALELAKAIKVQGSGIQTVAGAEVFDYEAMKKRADEQQSEVATWREVSDGSEVSSGS